MTTSVALASVPSPVPQIPALALRASEAAGRAVDWSNRAQKGDGHWCAELESNCSVTAEYVLMCQALGLELASKRAGLVQYLFEHQNEDGSWGIAHDHPGDIATTAECYLALRILEQPVHDTRLERACAFILRGSGLERM